MKEVLIGVAVRSSRLVTLDRAGPIVMRRPTDGLALGTLADYKARTGQDPVRGATTTGGRATVTVSLSHACMTWPVPCVPSLRAGPASRTAPRGAMAPKWR